MKKKIFTVFAAFAMVATTTAQEASSTDTRDKFAFGLKLGANLSNVYDSEGEDFVADAKLGFVGGGFVTIPLTKLFAIQPEVLFSQKGFKGEGTFLGSAYEYKRTTDYLDVPVFLAVRPIQYLSIMAGPQFSYLLKEKNEFSGIVDESTEEVFNNENARKNTMALVGGADVNIDNIVIGARVGFDLKKNNGDGTSETPRYKNYWYQLTLGYKF
ncbi:porin family protein [Flavobacterium sp.]